MTQKEIPLRGEFVHFTEIPTRWMDNDVYGHVNNVVYYAWFDTVVNRWLIENGLLDIGRSEIVGVVVETKCTYRKEFAFPDTVEAGLRVARLGNTSVTYEIGLFHRGDDEPAAYGYFVHVYVERATRRPVPIPVDVRRALESLLPGERASGGAGQSAQGM